MKPKTVDRWDLDVSFAGTTVHAVYQNFHALSKLEAEVRGMAYARINNPRSTVLKVKATPSYKREEAQARQAKADELLRATGGELWRAHA